MKKLKILSVLTCLLAFGLMVSSCAGLNAWLREGGGLVLEGMENFEGGFVIASGKAAGQTFTAMQYKTLEGALIEYGKTRLAVYGDGVTPFEGDVTVVFDVVIQDRPDVKTGKPLALGTATAKLTAGSAIAKVTITNDLRTPAQIAAAVPVPAPTPSVSTPTTPTAPAVPAASGSFDYRTIANNGIITAVTTAANAREKGQVFISGTTLTTAGGEQKILSATRDAALIAIAANVTAGVGTPGATQGWSKVQTLRVDGSNVIQEIVVIPQSSANSQLNPAQLNNFLASAKKVTITGEKNGTHALNCTQAQADSPANSLWTTVTIPPGTTLNLRAPTSGTAPVIRFSGYLTLVVNGTVESEGNAGKIAVTNTVTVKKGSKSGKGPGGDAGVTGSAFMSFVNGL